MAEIRRAEPRSRRLALGIVLLGALAGAAVIAAFEQYRADLDAWLKGDPADARVVLGVATAVVCLPVLGAAAWLWAYGDRIARAAIYPPPGGALVRDTRVLTGPAAIRRGRAIRALAAALWASGTGLLVSLWWLWASLP